MVRLKLSKEEFDPKALDIKVAPSTFKRYRGEIPRNGTILIFRVTRMWWTQSKAGDSQIYLMAFAEQNKGALKEFNGLPVREYLTFNPDAAFRYMNFLNCFGLTTRDIYNKMDVEATPDNIGDIITSIGGWVVGSDAALCRIALVRDRYDPDELKAKVDKEGWLPLDEDDESDESDDEDDDDDDEPPARTRRAKPAATKSRRRAEPEPEEDEPDDEDEDDDDDEEVDDDDVEEDEEDDEEEGQEEDDEDAEEDAPPASSRSTNRRSRDGGRTASRTRPAARGTGSGRRGSVATTPEDGKRTRSVARTSTARTARGKSDEDTKGFKGDPPF